jgi:hypothetical protein
MWRKIWIRDIEGILMILKGNIPKKETRRRTSNNRTPDLKALLATKFSNQSVIIGYGQSLQIEKTGKLRVKFDG